MIFYFSGTGNSKWIAREISVVQHERLISIADEMTNPDAAFQYRLTDNEMIGFVFPVYSWAPPAIVMDFIDKIRFENFRNPYMFFVCTCGDEVGLTVDIINKAAGKRGWSFNAGFSVIMPNNYVCLPGFDTDPKELEEKKLSEAVPAVGHINALLTARESDVFEYRKGSWPCFKSRIINPLFNKYQVTAKPFFATDSCISCGLCEKACPVHNIRVVDKPVWGEFCTSCLACYHVCPQQAVQYGKATRNKHQYFNPHH